MRVSGLDWYAPNPQCVGVEIAVPPATAESFWTNIDGDTPTESADTTDYELGNRFGVFAAAAPIFIRGVRIWSGGNDTGLTGRKARLWQVSGTVTDTLLAEVALPANLPAGWSEYSFPDMVEGESAADGNFYMVSYSTNGRYGVIADVLDANTDDGVVQYHAASGGAGRYSLMQGAIPDQVTASFYIDLLYSP